jgi:hypothetical protein
VRYYIESTVLVDTAPKVGRAFGMITPKDQSETLNGMYLAAASPQDFMAEVTASFEAGNYPGDFIMSALHVVGSLTFLYHLKTTDAYGNQAKKIGFSSTGMILQDIEQDWFSESLGQS